MKQYEIELIEVKKNMDSPEEDLRRRVRMTLLTILLLMSSAEARTLKVDDSGIIS